MAEAKEIGSGKRISKGAAFGHQCQGRSPWAAHDGSALRLGHASPVRDARFPSASGLKQDSCAVLGFSPSLRSIRAAHNGLALGKETVSDRQRKALTGPSVRPSMDRRRKSGHTKRRFPLPLHCTIF